MNCNVCRACDYRKLKSPRKLKFFSFLFDSQRPATPKGKKKKIFVVRNHFVDLYNSTTTTNKQLINYKL